MAMIMMQIVAAAGLAFVIVGVVLLVRGEKRSKDRAPRCGRCRYNLTANESNRCPECGGLFVEVGVTIGASPAKSVGRRVAFAALALILLLLGGSLFVSFVAQRQAASSRARALAAQKAASQQLTLARQQAQTAHAATSQPAKRIEAAPR